MAANDADPKLLSNTLQVFGLAYFVGIFGFPFVAGWIITESGMKVLLAIALVIAVIECFMAFSRQLNDRNTSSLSN